MLKQINIHEAKTRLSRVIAEIENYKISYIICRNGKPVASLVPFEKKNRFTPHPTMGKIELKYNPIEPLSDDEWPGDK